MSRLRGPASAVVTAAVSLALLGLTPLPVGAVAAPLAPEPELTITGFQGEWSPPSKIHASADALTTVGVDGVAIASSGQSVPSPSADARKQLRATHRDELVAEVLVSNYDEELGDFSEPIAHRLLSSSSNIDSVADRLATAVVEQGWDGVAIDLEALRARDRDGLTRFATAVREALPPDASLSIDVSLHSSVRQYRLAGYDLEALADIVDRITLMAYDQHGPWERRPGPVGALAWQEVGLRAMLGAVPARQVELGVAGYGYAWRPSSTVTVSDARARRLVASDGATASFDAEVGEWTATLSDGSVLWWSDARSFELRVTLAEQYGLGGLAVWSLGLSDPIEPI